MESLEEIKQKKEDLIKLHLTDSHKPKKYWVDLSVYNNQIIDIQEAQLIESNRLTKALQDESNLFREELESGCDCEDVNDFNTNDLINEIRRRKGLNSPLGMIETDRIIEIVTKNI
jgi:hypothetical protein